MKNLHQPGPPCGAAVSGDRTRSCNRPAGHAGRHLSVLPAADAALGRITGCDSTTGGGDGQDQANNAEPEKKQGEPATRAAREPASGTGQTTSAPAPIQGVPAIETSTLVPCMKCRQLLLELEQARADFTTFGVQLFRDLPKMTVNQIDEFQKRMQPIEERLKKAKSAYRRHAERCDGVR